eukprot:CAMPEP_0194322214 /NCGR_PEP_ID=MMETSP0171-20130528/18388_1 /TAXON_ID=218684 /ORGANISM="Corethron pennatum, Strain L29A3" /LENGTH=36 /DNA_ID= /DNA_START= /DNA_END= /DNA_ORIENTATION=
MRVRTLGLERTSNAFVPGRARTALASYAAMRVATLG